MITFRKELEHIEETKEGATIPNVSYYKFIYIAPFFDSSELTDEEIIFLANQSKQFNFLENSEEDIYTLSDGTPL